MMIYVPYILKNPGSITLYISLLYSKILIITIAIRSSCEVDRSHEEHCSCQEKLGQLSEVQAPTAQHHQQHDHAQGAEQPRHEGIAREVVAHHHPVEELTLDDHQQVQDEQIDEAGARSRTGRVGVPEGAEGEFLGLGGDSGRGR